MPGWGTACICFTHSCSASVIPQVSTVTAAGEHPTAFPWGPVIYTIPVQDRSAVSLIGPALKRDCICVRDRDGAGPVPAGSSPQHCFPWARPQLWWVPWEAKRAGVQERWDSLIIEVHIVYLRLTGTQHTFHTLPFLFPSQVPCSGLLLIISWLVAQALPTTPFLLLVPVVWCWWRSPGCLLLPVWYP